MKNISLNKMILVLFFSVFSYELYGAANPLPRGILIGMNFQDRRFKQYLKKEVKQIVKYQKRLRMLKVIMYEHWFRKQQEEQPFNDYDVPHDDKEIEEYYKRRNREKKRS